MINIIHLNKTESTNTYAKALLNMGEPLPPYTVVFAKEQTAGRGRLGRDWYSKEGDSLCMSLIVPYHHKPCITLLCALGVYEALCRLCDSKLMIKWPNDIIAESKKLCGILVEGLDKASVIGIGINLNSEVFPEDIAHKATSLRLLTGKAFEQEAVAKLVAESVFDTLRQYNCTLTENAKEKYTYLCANLGREVSFEGGRGVATGISPEGALRVQTKTGTKDISFGEVFVNGIY